MRGGGHATELPGRGQYSLSEKLRARRKLGNRPRCETYSIPQSSVSGRARPAAGIFLQRARSLGTRGTWPEGPTSGAGAGLLSQGSRGSARCFGFREMGTLTGALSCPPRARRGPQPGFGEISGRGQRPGCSSKGTGSGSGSPPAQDSLT